MKPFVFACCASRQTDMVASTIGVAPMRGPDAGNNARAGLDSSAERRARGLTERDSAQPDAGTAGGGILASWLARSRLRGRQHCYVLRSSSLAGVDRIRRLAMSPLGPVRLHGSGHGHRGLWRLPPWLVVTGATPRSRAGLSGCRGLWPGRKGILGRSAAAD